MIIVECYADEAFLTELGISSSKIRHEGGVGRVLEKIEKGFGSAGMIDEDPGKSRPKEINNFRIEREEGDHSMRVHKENDAHLLVLKPDLEGWLIGRARSLKIDMKDLDLPDDPYQLHSLPRYESKEGFKKLVQELFRKDDSIRTIIEWLDPGDQKRSSFP